MAAENLLPGTEILTTRIVFFARDLVFKAWSDPVHLQRWWGPSGFTNSFHEFHFHPGGRWKFTMHGPEKGNYENECVFMEIHPPLVIHWQRISKPLFEVMVQFEEATPGETRIVWRMIFPSVEDCNKLRPFVVEKNEENLDRLEAELARMNN